MATATDDRTEGALSDEEAQAFRQRCIDFLEEHATGIHLGGDPDPRAEKRLAGGQGVPAEAGRRRPRRHHLPRRSTAAPG